MKKIIRTLALPNKNHGFALVVTLSLMILLTLLAVGLLSLSAIALRNSSANEARAVAMANARLGLSLALGEIQKHLGDDRRITADASLLMAAQDAQTSENAFAVGVWNSWSPDLASQTARGRTPRVDYIKPKSQNGFRTWLVSSVDNQAIQQLNWYATNSGNRARLFTEENSGFNLGGEKIPVKNAATVGTTAWAVTQENTKARIDFGIDESTRTEAEDALQSPARVNLSNSKHLSDPGASTQDAWLKRRAALTSMAQVALDKDYGSSPTKVSLASRDFTTNSRSLLTNPVKGGLKFDLNSAFELPNEVFNQSAWDGTKNPFRSSTPTSYQGELPLFTPVETLATASVNMNYPPISPKVTFTINGVPTMDMLRSYYRQYRHLYQSAGELTAFERPFSHVALNSSSKVPGRPFGVKSQSGLNPVLDRVSLVLSWYAKSDGSLGLLLTPFVTVWNPYNVAIESEGMVLYPWIDLAVHVNFKVRPASSPSSLYGSGGSLSRMVSDGWGGHGRNTKPYFYFHLTKNGDGHPQEAIHLEPGEIRVFCLAGTERRDLMPKSDPKARTLPMKAVANANDLVTGRQGGFFLNFSQPNVFNDLWLSNGSSPYKLRAGDILQQGHLTLNRQDCHYFMNLVDGWQIKNPNTEMMASDRAADGGLPVLKAEPNLHFYTQIHTGTSFAQTREDKIDFPAMRFEEIRENPRMIGSILSYHHPTDAGRNGVSDLMFTMNPRQPFATEYLSPGAKFQTSPNYENVMLPGTSLAAFTMETTVDGRNAFYGGTNSVINGRTHVPVFEIPRSAPLSLGAFQHCDLTASVYGNPNQIGNSWASPNLADIAVVNRVATSPGGSPINPSLNTYDTSYLANEALFDGYFLSGLTPEVQTPAAKTGTPATWDQDQRTETKSMDAALASFLNDPSSHPLRNPRMMPWLDSESPASVLTTLSGPKKTIKLASYLLCEGGFNVNSTSIEAWTAMLSSLRDMAPASSERTLTSRFRNVLTAAGNNMTENDPWSGFRSLSDDDIHKLAKNLVNEVRARGPFLSLGEFVNRQISSDANKNLSGAIQRAIDKSDLNNIHRYAPFDTSPYSYPNNIQPPNTGVNTPGWLTQADILTALAPSLTVRSDTFLIRSQGEAKDGSGKVLASVTLEATVQRIPGWIEATDEPSLEIAKLNSTANQKFGRKFVIVAIKELHNSGA